MKNTARIKVGQNSINDVQLEVNGTRVESACSGFNLSCMPGEMPKLTIMLFCPGLEAELQEFLLECEKNQKFDQGVEDG